MHRLYINIISMKKTTLLLVSICLCFSAFSQTLKNITWEDTTRQYLEYVPESYDSSTPTPVVFIFHGLGGNMYEVRENADFDRIADAHGWITITPQALPDTFTAMDTTLTMNAWHSGVSAIVGEDTIVASEGRDDTGLMMAILDSLINHYNIDTNNIFCTGVSMGGFMSNRMAIEHGDRIKAIASVCGTIGNEIVSYTPVGHVSAMHVHGTADSIVTYNDGNFQYGLVVNVGLGAEATVEFWRSYNQCSDTAVHTLYPDLMEDDRTFERFEYDNGIYGTKTVLIKVNGGQHEWCHGPWRDVDITDEIYEFFASCLNDVYMDTTIIIDTVPTDTVPTDTIPIDTNGIFHYPTANIHIYPNPTTGMVNVQWTMNNGQCGDAEIQVLDLYGRLLDVVVISDARSASLQSMQIDLSQYATGLYLIRLINNGQVLATSKIIKQP